MDINEIAAAFGKEFSGAYYSDCIDKWQRIYRDAPEWRQTAKGGLFSRGKRQLLRLNMAKVLCDNLAALTFSEQFEITLDSQEYQAYIDDTLTANGFWKQLPELLSKSYAMGGGVLKCYLSGGKPRIDYITADRFVPVSWDGSGVQSGIQIKAIMEVQKCDESTAREELERMSQESGGGSIADFFGNE